MGRDGGYVYTVESRGYLRALRYGVTGTGMPSLSSAGTSAGTFGYTSVGNLRTGTHAVDVTVTAAGHLVVKVDGAQLIDVAVSLPANVLAGFTAATGGTTDQHTVRNAVMSY